MDSFFNAVDRHQGKVNSVAGSPGQVMVGYGRGSGANYKNVPVVYKAGPTISSSNRSDVGFPLGRPPVYNDRGQLTA